MKQVGVFVATRWEFNAVREVIAVDKQERTGTFRGIVGRQGHVQVRLIQTGMGIERAGAVSREALAAYSFELVVSTGFACALSSAGVGDLLIGTDVILYGETPASSLSSLSLACSIDYTEAAVRAAQKAVPAPRCGRFVTVPGVLWRAEQKREVAVATGGIAADMESAAIARSAHERRVPFIIVRAASDLAEEDLSLDFNLFLQPAGWLRGLARIVTHPSTLVGCHRLRMQSREAAARLTAFYGTFFDALQE